MTELECLGCTHVPIIAPNVFVGNNFVGNIFVGLIQEQYQTYRSKHYERYCQVEGFTGRIDPKMWVTAAK